MSRNGWDMVECPSLLHPDVDGWWWSILYALSLSLSLIYSVGFVVAAT